MSRWRGFVVGALTGLVMAAATGHAQDAVTGRTGATHPADLVTARQLLMSAVEAEMMVIDGAVIDGTGRLESLTARAYAINILLLAFSHLFAPETAPGAMRKEEGIQIRANALVWHEFTDFYDRVQASAAIAFDASQAPDLGAFRTAGRTLRETCDSCHARFMGQP
jgi:hypothetical protein